MQEELQAGEWFEVSFEVSDPDDCILRSRIDTYSIAGQ